MAGRVVAGAVGIALLATAGCASAPKIVPIPKLVRVPDTKALNQYRAAVHKALSAPCPASADRAVIATVNDLIGAFNKEQAWGQCVTNKNTHADAIKPPPPQT